MLYTYNIFIFAHSFVHLFHSFYLLLLLFADLSQFTYKNIWYVSGTPFAEFSGYTPAWYPTTVELVFFKFTDFLGHQKILQGTSFSLFFCYK